MRKYSTTKKEPPLINNLLKLFMTAMVLANIAGMMYGSLLPLYLKILNASVVQIGLFFTLSSILPLILQILGGWISDTLGRLRSIAMGSVAGVLSYVGLILAPTWQWVLLGEGLGAVTRSLIGPSFSAFIADQSAEENRARVFGITDSIFMLVLVIGPPLGGWMADVYGFRVMLISSGIIYTFAAMIRIGMARTAARGAEANPEKLSLSSLKRKSRCYGRFAFGRWCDDLDFNHRWRPRYCLYHVIHSGIPLPGGSGWIINASNRLIKFGFWDFQYDNDYTCWKTS